MFGLGMHDMARGIAQSGVLNLKQRRTEAMSRMQSGHSWKYQDTQTNATMRQRGLQSIQQSRMNMSSALGNEARSLHNGAMY